MKENDLFYVISDGGNNIIKTNVDHLITLRFDGNIHEAPDMKIGYAGAGPNELGANMLFMMNVDEQICLQYASRFRSEVMDRYMKCDRDNTYTLPKSRIWEWLRSNNISAREFG